MTATQGRRTATNPWANNSTRTSRPLPSNQAAPARSSAPNSTRVVSHGRTLLFESVGRRLDLGGRFRAVRERGKGVQRCPRIPAGRMQAEHEVVMGDALFEDDGSRIGPVFPNPLPLPLHDGSLQTIPGTNELHLGGVGTRERRPVRLQDHRRANHLQDRLEDSAIAHADVPSRERALGVSSADSLDRELLRPHLDAVHKEPKHAVVHELGRSEPRSEKQGCKRYGDEGHGAQESNTRWAYPSKCGTWPAGWQQRRRAHSMIH